MDLWVSGRSGWAGGVGRAGEVVGWLYGRVEKLEMLYHGIMHVGGWAGVAVLSYLSCWLVPNDINLWLGSFIGRSVIR